jgi:glycosyltransferase involved in cell wall biosynthesis
MPVYNAADYLAGAIKSILTQTFTSIELIIVDDGSDDGSLQIAKQFEAADKRIRLIVQEGNKGNYPSRNHGMAVARGEFIAVMDSDDIALPDRFERQVQFLREHPGYTMVGSRVLLIDPEGAPIGPKGGLYTEHEDLDAALMERKWAVVHPTVLMRRSAVEAVGGYREKFRTCADHDIYIRLAELGRVANLPEVLLCYRQHYSSLTRLKSDQQHNLRLIQREARERRNLSPLKDEPLPPIQEPEALQRRQKMRLRYTWAEIAMREGYVSSALKNIGLSFALDPIGALHTSLRLVRRRAMGR